jgi:signal transduction histidine kinase
MEPDFSLFDIHTLLEETLELAEDRIRLKSIKVERKYAVNLRPIRVDVEKMKIALLNLIINAVEAMEENTGVLSICTEKRNGRCVITIADNGYGIPEEFLPRLFEPFFTRKNQGTGLGLTSTQSIILSHKGSINVRSEVEKGTSFLVSLDLENSSN